MRAEQPDKATGRALERIAAAVLAEIERAGLLVVHDQVIPSVTALVAGGPILGSWWSHPRAHDMYNAMELIEDQVANVKLVLGKQTLVAQRLWPELLAIGTARSSWQMDGVPADAVALLGETDAHPQSVHVPPSRRDACSALETRLLVMAGSEHTESGRHAKTIMSWAAWAQTRGVVAVATQPEVAMGAFEHLVIGWPPTRRRLFPWPRA